MEYVNKVSLYGVATRELEYSHEFDGQPFYSLELKVLKSQNVIRDVYVRCYFTGKQLAKYEIHKGATLSISGKLINSKVKGIIDISILVNDYDIIEEDQVPEDSTCETEVSGTVTKIFTTESNFSGLVNFVVAHINNDEYKSFSTRVVIWGRLSEHVFKTIQVGDNVLIKGIMNNSTTNAREYDKEGNLIPNDHPEEVKVSEVLGTYFTKISD